jgi:RND family efflux transporter MFP subunit
LTWAKIALPAAIILVGSLGLAILVYGKPKPESKEPDGEKALVTVSVVPALAETLRLSVDSQGTVTPHREIDVVAQVSGQVLSVEPFYVEGGFFDKDQALLQIDDSDYKVALLSAKARHAEAERKLAEEQGLGRQAKREWRDLGNDKANDLFIRKPQLAAAEAALAFAAADVSKAELELARTRITVPFNGRIKQVLADLGQYVTIGARLATVYDTSVIEVRLPLTEQQAALVDLPLMASKKNPPRVELSASVGGKPQTWQGVVSRTDAFIDPDTRMYFAVVEVNDPFADPLAPLLPGLFVDASIEGKIIPNVFVFPRSAVFERNKIFVLDEQNSILSKSVNILRKTADKVWLLADIEDGALVSLDKQSLTPVGSQVSPIVVSDNPANGVPRAATNSISANIAVPAVQP